MSIQFQSSVSFLLVGDYFFEFLHDSVEAPDDVVSSGGVPVSEVIGFLPLSDEVLGGDVIAVMVEGPSSDFGVSESDSSVKPSEIGDLVSISLEEGLDLLGLFVFVFEDFFLLDSGVVGSV